MTEEEHIKKGFNAGYLLEKHDPQLSQTLQAGFVDKEAPYATGFIAGSQEYAQENQRGNLSILSKYMNHSEQPEADKEPESNDNDMER